MYGLVRYDLTKEEILKRVSYLDLWSYYIPGVQLKKPFLSPLRDEKTPSANIFPTQDGKIIFKDFKLGTYTIWNFLMEKYHLTFREMLLMINNDFNLGLEVNNKNRPTMEFYGIPKKQKVPKDNPETIIEIKKRDFNKWDELYWKQYHLPIEFISKRNVYALQNFWINDKLVYWYNQYNPAYCYDFVSDKKKKIYCPYSKNYRFVTNADNSVWQGDDFLNLHGDNLIITKSYKDVLALSFMNNHSVSPQSESQIFSEQRINMYKRRFENIYVLYDNDEVGIKYSTLNCQKYELKQIFIPLNSDCKDITDYLKKYGINNSINLLKTLIKNV